ncbi:unnamed protein product [Caretta caretta]
MEILWKFKGPTIWMNVILDPETSHPRLILSEDQKSVNGETQGNICRTIQRDLTLGLCAGPLGIHLRDILLGCGGGGQRILGCGSGKRVCEEGREKSALNLKWGSGLCSGWVCFQALTSPATILPPEPGSPGGSRFVWTVNGAK